MTQEEKQLLLKDLCARLPYKVKLGFENSDLILVPEEFNVYTKQLSTNQIYPKVDRAVIKHIYDVWNYRPYLRPMSSMTEEEAIKYITLTHYNTDDNGKPYRELTINAIDWLNEHQFDYRIDPTTGETLIGKGLALEAPKGIYETE